MRDGMVEVRAGEAPTPAGAYSQGVVANRLHYTPPYPARTTVGSTLPGIGVEIDLDAALPGR